MGSRVRAGKDWNFFYVTVLGGIGRFDAAAWGVRVLRCDRVSSEMWFLGRIVGFLALSSCCSWAPCTGESGRCFTRAWSN